MSERARGAWVVDVLPLTIAVLVTGRIAGAWAARVSYPFDLEWMEGGMLAHAWRLTHGLPLYPEAGPEWIPYVYPPGYPALLAALAPLAGLEYAPGRIVSVFGVCAAAGILAATVARRGSWLVGLVCAAVFVGCWRASGAFYDLVRPDGLAMALLAGVIALARIGGPGAPRAQVGAGLLLALAFTIKHHTAAFGVPLALGLWYSLGWGAARRFALASAVPALLFTLAMQWGTAGRFVEYLLVVPGTHPWIWARIFPGAIGELSAWVLPSLVVGAGWIVVRSPAARSDLMPAVVYGVPALLAAVAAGAVWVAPPPRGVQVPPNPVIAIGAASVAAAFGAFAVSAAHAVQRRPARDAAAERWWMAVGVSGFAFVVALAMRGHNGGFMNVLMPMHYAAALGLGLVVVDIRRRDPRIEVRVATAALLAVQVGWVGWNTEIAEVVPTPADVRAGEQVIERLRACPPGPILSPHAAWLPVLAGREPSVPLIALWDVDHPRNPFQGAAEAMADAAAAHRWSCVLSASRQRIGYGIEENYRVDETFSFEEATLQTKTGWRVRPLYVLVPRGVGP